MGVFFQSNTTKTTKKQQIICSNVCMPFLQVSCKVLHFFHMYMLGCNYFWMLCEGIYLHTLIVVAVFAEEQHLHWYYLLGWGEFFFYFCVKCIVLLYMLDLKKKTDSFHYAVYQKSAGCQNLKIRLQILGFVTKCQTMDMMQTHL